jgi:hypothetical protein
VEQRLLRWPRDHISFGDLRETGVNPDHYVRPEDDAGADAPTPSSARRRITRRLRSFLFNKTRDDTPPGIFPNKGFNSNGRRHS